MTPGNQTDSSRSSTSTLESQSVEGIALRACSAGDDDRDGLLANLASQVVQARSLRWISSDTIARHLTEQLQAARAAIVRRQLDTSGNILRALHNEIAAQSGKTLTSEAVALVDLNVQYILRRVAEP